MAAFYERWLWITKIFFAGESRLSPRAAIDDCSGSEQRRQYREQWFVQSVAAHAGANELSILRGLTRLMHLHSIAASWHARQHVCDYLL